MPIADHIAQKLRKLVLLLSSSSDGEVLGTRAAISRILDANGLSWHDLAGLMDGSAVKSSPPPPQDQPEYSDRPWQDVARNVLENSRGRFSAKEQQFLEDMSVWHAQPSKKQLDWLASLHNRANRQWADV